MWVPTDEVEPLAIPHRRSHRRPNGVLLVSGFPMPEADKPGWTEVVAASSAVATGVTQKGRDPLPADAELTGDLVHRHPLPMERTRLAAAHTRAVRMQQVGVLGEKLDEERSMLARDDVAKG